MLGVCLCFCLSLSDMHAPADYKLGCYDPPNKSQSHAEQWSSVLIRPPFAFRIILMKLSQPDWGNMIVFHCQY